MTRRRKANIWPDLTGELFTDGEGYFKLLFCNTEPTAAMIDLSNPAIRIEKPISFFANFVHLKPVRPIEKPKKPRADLGKPHKKAATVEDKPDDYDKKGDNLFIHVPTETEGDMDYVINIAGSEARGPESIGLRRVVMAALEKWNGEIPDILNRDERNLIQGILEAGDTP